MLVRFNSEVGGFVMFGDVAVKLLRMTGHSGRVPGAIPAEEMAQALDRLEARLLAQTSSSDDAGADDRHDESNSSGNNSGNEDAGSDGGTDADPPVSLAQRAFPMIELMRRALAEQCAIQWRED